MMFFGKLQDIYPASEIRLIELLVFIRIIDEKVTAS